MNNNYSHSSSRWLSEKKNSRLQRHRRQKMIVLVSALITLFVLLAILLVQTDRAEAHTVTASMCQRAANEAAPPRSAVLPTYRRCMNYRAKHNLCHGVAKCHSWLLVAICETGNRRYSLTKANIDSIRWRYKGSSGYDGALQFSPDTWNRTGSRFSFAYQAPPGEQMKRAEVWRGKIGGSAHSSAGWPSCGRYRG